jgi:hypothetical protein
MLQMKSLSQAVSTSICAAAIALGGGAAYGQTTSPAPEAKPQPDRQACHMMVGEKEAGAMMAQCRQMMARMQADDQKLNELVTRMDAAKSPDNIDAVAAVVKELVAQRAQMRGEMMAMQGRMIGHMAQHTMPMASGTMGMMNRGSSQMCGACSVESCAMTTSVTQPAEADPHQHEIK